MVPLYTIQIIEFCSKLDQYNHRCIIENEISNCFTQKRILYNIQTLLRALQTLEYFREYQLRINETLSQLNQCNSIFIEGRKEGREEDNCREGASNDRAKYRHRWHSLKMLEGQGWYLAGDRSARREINHLNWRKEKSRLIAQDPGRRCVP